MALNIATEVAKAAKRMGVSESAARTRALEIGLARMIVVDRFKRNHPDYAAKAKPAKAAKAKPAKAAKAKPAKAAKAKPAKAAKAKPAKVISPAEPTLAGTAEVNGVETPVFVPVGETVPE